MRRIPVILALALTAGPAADLRGQAPEARPEDVASPEAIVAASYEVISRRPGEDYDWDREFSLFLPNALLIPNVEQMGGAFRPLTPREFRAWIDGWHEANAPIGGPQDRGFVEEEVHRVVERYGDVAHVMSTYVKRFADDDRILGRGINSFQLVRHDGRWWIAGIAWDEEDAAGPIPPRYLPPDR